MIVDLMRNDIGRIAEIGSVEVTDLFTVETYKTLHQMTSGVRSTLKNGTSGVLDLLQGDLPAGLGDRRAENPRHGTDPRIGDGAARRLLRRHRPLLAGAATQCSTSRSARQYLSRRTTAKWASARASCSTAQAPKEYAECLLKMKFLTDPPKRFELIETMLYEPGGGLWLIERHIAPARGLGAHTSALRSMSAAVRAALDDCDQGRQPSGCACGCCLPKTGRSRSRTTAQPAPPPTVMRFVISPTRAHSADLFLYHKTTRREVYDREWAALFRYRSARMRSSISTSGASSPKAAARRSSSRTSGKLLTPALSSGLLPGTLRAELLAAGRAEEAVLTLADLATADGIYLGNSVRGLVAARPIDEP